MCLLFLITLLIVLYQNFTSSFGFFTFGFETKYFQSDFFFQVQGKNCFASAKLWAFFPNLTEKGQNHTEYRQTSALVSPKASSRWLPTLLNLLKHSWEHEAKSQSEIHLLITRKKKDFWVFGFNLSQKTGNSSVSLWTLICFYIRRPTFMLHFGWKRCLPSSNIYISPKN